MHKRIELSIAEDSPLFRQWIGFSCSFTNKALTMIQVFFVKLKDSWAFSKMALASAAHWFQKWGQIKQQYLVTPIQLLFETYTLILLFLWPIEILTATPVLFHCHLPNLDFLSWLWVIVVMTHRFFSPKRFHPFFKDKVFIAFIFLLGVWTIIAYHRTPFHDYFSFLWTQRFVLWLVLIWITSRVRWPPMLVRKIAYVVVGIGALISLHAIVEQVAWFRWHKALSYQPELFARAHHLSSSATFYNPNLLASFLMFTITVSLWLDFYRYRQQKRNWGLLFVLVLLSQVIALGYTYSRSGFVLLVVFAITLIALGFFHSQLKLARSFLVTHASFLLLVLFVFVLTNPAMQWRLHAFIPTESLTVEEVTHEHSAEAILRDFDPQGHHIIRLPSNRIVMWHGALKVIRHYPWMGIGFGNFRCFFNRWHAHQLPLEVAVASGLVGTGFFLILILFLLKAWIKVLKIMSRSPKRQEEFVALQMIAWAAMSVTAVFFFHSFVEYLLGSISIVGYTGFFLGLIYHFSFTGTSKES